MPCRPLLSKQSQLIDSDDLIYQSSLPYAYLDHMEVCSQPDLAADQVVLAPKMCYSTWRLEPGPELSVTAQKLFILSSNNSPSSKEGTKDGSLISGERAGDGQ